MSAQTDIAADLTRILGAKSDLKTSIEGKGVTVPAATKIDGYAALVDQIQQGGGGGGHTFTGTVDSVGLAALGWDSYDIQWLQDHVWWDAADDNYWAVTQANLALGPNGSTPLTWSNRSSIKFNQDVRYLPKFNPSPSSSTSWSTLLYDYKFLFAVPTHGWDTTYVNNLYLAFGNSFNLHSVGDLSGWSTSNVTSMASMFANCYTLRDIGNVSNWDIRNCTSIQAMFTNCQLLQSLDVSGWMPEKITNLETLFNNCQSLTSIGDLSNWDVSKVTNFKNVFGSCRRLVTTGDLSDWDTSSATTMESMFANCNSLVDIGDISDWDVSGVTSFQNMFMYCWRLVDIGDLSDWTTTALTKNGSMFYDCISLRSVGDLSGWDMDSVTDAHQTYGNMRSLYEIDVTGWDLSACTNVGTNDGQCIFANMAITTTIKLGPKFFNFSPTTFYVTSCWSWSRDSIYESLYTNQTLRNSSSTAVTVKLATTAYDRLSAQDISDIATKNITLTRG